MTACARLGADQRRVRDVRREMAPVVAEAMPTIKALTAIAATVAPSAFSLVLILSPSVDRVPLAGRAARLDGSYLYGRGTLSKRG